MGRHAIRSAWRRRRSAPPLPASRRGTSSSSRRSSRSTRAASSPGATAAEQADRALENLAHQLRSTGLSLEDVVSLEIHLVDQADRAAVDAALEARFMPPYPAVTLSGVPWLPGGARLQVAAIAQRY